MCWLRLVNRWYPGIFGFTIRIILIQLVSDLKAFYRGWLLGEEFGYALFHFGFSTKINLIESNCPIACKNALVKCEKSIMILTNFVFC